MPTTASGTAYTVTTATVPGHHLALYGIADTVRGRRVVPTLVYCHGAGGAYDNFAAMPAWAGLRNWLIDNGWAWVEGTGAPTAEQGEVHWGNTGARAAYQAYLAWARAQYDVGPVVVLGRSMGGLIASWLYARSPIRGDIVGMIGNSAVSTMFVGDGPGGATLERATGAYFSTMKTAYGITNPDAQAAYAELQAAAADHAPESWPASVWARKRVLHVYGDADTSVPWETRGGGPMRALWAGLPARDWVEVKPGGDHSADNGSYSQVDAMTRFLAALAPVQRLTPVALNHVAGLQNMLVTAAYYQPEEGPPRAVSGAYLLSA